MNLNWNEKAFLIGLLDKRLKEEPDCKIAKQIKEMILIESPVLRRVLYGKTISENGEINE